MNYCARDFDEYIEVETPEEVDDGFGGCSQTWSTLAFLWAKVEDKTGREAEVNGRIESVKTLEVTTHYRDDIGIIDRFVVDSRYYNIERIEDVDRKRRYIRFYLESHGSDMVEFLQSEDGDQLQTESGEFIQGSY